ncbi:MAG: hypothetical protein Q4B59_00635 [Lachnospiraceae bacterium]|nr:hypothetical protein [Lachnospiraceae bacterium]
MSQNNPMQEQPVQEQSVQEQSAKAQPVQEQPAQESPAQSPAHTAQEYREEAERHARAAKDTWKQFGKTGIFVAAAFVALVLLAMAWFVSNNRVHALGGRISAGANSLRLASKGERQEPESEVLQLDTGGELVFNNETYHVSDGGEVALYLDDQYEMKPGASGLIEFYIIPRTDGAAEVTLYVQTVACVTTKENGIETAAVNEADETLNALLSGHLLFFEKQENGTYSEWIALNGEGDHVMKIQMDASAKADEPYLCQIYWVWPEHLAVLEEISGMDAFISEQAQAAAASAIEGTDGYLYSRLFIADSFPLSEKADQSRAYDLADEYIGSNMDYVYFTVRSTPREGNNG